MSVKRYYNYDELQVGDYFISDDSINPIDRVFEKTEDGVRFVCPANATANHGRTITIDKSRLIRIRSHWNPALSTVYLNGLVEEYQKEFYRDWVG